MEGLQQALADLVYLGWDNQAAVDHPALVEMADADQQVLDQDLNWVVAGLLEEDEEQRLGLVEDPISEASQAQASEPGQSTGHLLSAQEPPTSKPGTEFEMPEEASVPDQPDHRNQEIQLPVSRPFDPASEKRSSQDRVHLTDSVLASTVMENSSVMVQVEFCSLAEGYRRGRAPRMEEGGAKV